MKTLSYDALLPALFSHISQSIEIPVLIDFIKTEFGIEHLEYLEDGIFEMDEKAFEIFLGVEEGDIDYLRNNITNGWNEIEEKQEEK
mgnify:CR=1 FL=1